MCYLLKHKSSFSSTKAAQHHLSQMDGSTFNGLVSEHRLDMPHLLYFQFISSDWARKSQESRVKLQSLPFKLIFCCWFGKLPHSTETLQGAYVWLLKVRTVIESVFCVLLSTLGGGHLINIKQEDFIESLYTIHFLVHPLCQPPVQKHMNRWVVG